MKLFIFFLSLDLDQQLSKGLANEVDKQVCFSSCFCVSVGTLQRSVNRNQSNHSQFDSVILFQLGRVDCLLRSKLGMPLYAVLLLTNT